MYVGVFVCMCTYTTVVAEQQIHYRLFRANTHQPVSQSGKQPEFKAIHDHTFPKCVNHTTESSKLIDESSLMISHD